MGWIVAALKTRAQNCEVTRFAIFAISGQLRELAGLVEKEAVALSKFECETDRVPTIQPNRKKESESDDIGTKNCAGAD